MKVDINLLIIQIQQMSLWETIWLGIKMMSVLAPSFWALGHFIFKK